MPSTAQSFHRSPYLLASFALALAGLLACGGEPADDAATPAPTAEAVAPEGEASATEGMLPRPFSADEIRGAWVEGLSVALQNATPQGIQFQRWSVVSADETGAEIEFAMTDPSGAVIGEPTRRRSGWEELAAHGDSPAATTTRQQETRETPLGELAGWTYTLTDPASESVTESFFSDQHPGAPVLMVVTQSGVETLRMAMVEWTVGETPESSGGGSDGADAEDAAGGTSGDAG